MMDDLMDSPRWDVIRRGHAVAARIQQRQAARERASNIFSAAEDLPIATDDEIAQINAATDAGQEMFQSLAALLQWQVDGYVTAFQRFAEKVRPLFTEYNRNLMRAFNPREYHRMMLREARRRARLSTQRLQRRRHA